MTRDRRILFVNPPLSNRERYGKLAAAGNILPPHAFLNLGAWCRSLGYEVRIVDPAAEYYDDYYAVFFLDPDGLKLEGMKYGEQLAHKSLKKKV